MSFVKTASDIIEHDNITFVPSIHGRYEFGVITAELFHALRPEAIAVELPNTIQETVEKAIDRLPYLSVVLYQEKSGKYVYLPIEPQDACITGAKLARDNSIPLFFIDKDTEEYPLHRETLPDTYTINRIGLSKYVEAYTNEFDHVGKSHEDELREMTMAYHLQQLKQKYGRILCICGLAHYSGIIRLLDKPLTRPLGRVKRDNVTLANLAKESSREILSEMPYISGVFYRGIIEENNPDVLDRLQIHNRLLRESADNHRKNSKDEIKPYQFRILNKFARNYALIQNFLIPDLFQLLVASRGAVDDNYAYEVWDLATNYPWQDENSQLPTLRLSGEDLYLDTKKIKFYRRFRHFRRKLVSVPIKQRNKEKNPGEWKEAWKGENICSYPPEDIVIEGFGDYLKKKTIQVLSEENNRTTPFVTSMLDGIDIRETIRNWHEEKLYVTEKRQISGKVGSVVVIFDEDAGDSTEEKYPWKMTWLGEHEQESDMAFYSTPAGDTVIGPGVSKCEYGGFMLTYPPLRLYDIWRDDFFNGARTKAERLLLAGIDYSEEKLIAYIAARPPAGRIKSLANLYGKKVIYLPIGQFSPVTLKKLKVFHVLEGHKVREWADDYIF